MVPHLMNATSSSHFEFLEEICLRVLVALLAFLWMEYLIVALTVLLETTAALSRMRCLKVALPPLLHDATLLRMRKVLNVEVLKVARADDLMMALPFLPEVMFLMVPLLMKATPLQTSVRVLLQEATPLKTSILKVAVLSHCMLLKTTLLGVLQVLEMALAVNLKMTHFFVVSSDGIVCGKKVEITQRMH